MGAFGVWPLAVSREAGVEMGASKRPGAKERGIGGGAAEGWGLRQVLRISQVCAGEYVLRPFSDYLLGKRAIREF